MTNVRKNDLAALFRWIHCSWFSLNTKQRARRIEVLTVRRLDLETEEWLILNMPWKGEKKISVIRTCLVKSQDSDPTQSQACAASQAVNIGIHWPTHFYRRIAAAAAAAAAVADVVCTCIVTGFLKLYLLALQYHLTLEADFVNFVNFARKQSILLKLLPEVCRVSHTGYHIDDQTLESVARPSVTVALHCFTDAKLLWQHAQMWLPGQQGSVRVVFEWYHYISRPPNRPLLQESGTYLLYKPSYAMLYLNSQLFVTMATEVGRRPIWMTPWYKKKILVLQLYCSCTALVRTA